MPVVVAYSTTMLWASKKRSSAPRSSGQGFTVRYGLDRRDVPPRSRAENGRSAMA